MDNATRRKNDERGCHITAVDMANTKITVLDQYGATLYISLDALTPLVSIPNVGENWFIVRKGQNWYLDRRQDTGNESTKITTLQPGDSRLETPSTLYINAEEVLINGHTLTDGVDGQPGIDGLPGPIGAMGLDGLDGLRGPIGIQGPDGLDGNRGPAGADGIAGLDGPPGPVGPPGIDGIDGGSSYDARQQPFISASALSGGPPPNPRDGDIWTGLAAGIGGENWTFRFNAGSASTFKWEAQGCTPVHYYNNNLVSVTVATPTLAFGSIFVLPRSGDYIISWGGNMTNPDWDYYYVYLYVNGSQIGGAGLIEMFQNSGETGRALSLSKTTKITGAAATYVIDIYHENSNGSSTVSTDALWASLIPVRII